MTKQQTFDRLMDHLRYQSGKSQRHGFAMIREDSELIRADGAGDRGRKDPIGCLLPLRNYHWTMERAFSAYSADVATALIGLGHDVHLVEAFRQLHDRVAVSEWEGGFSAIADRFELDYEDPAMAAA